MFTSVVVSVNAFPSGTSTFLGKINIGIKTRINAMIKILHPIKKIGLTLNCFVDDEINAITYSQKK